MRIGFISTRLNGTDGVSLEVEKWVTVLRRMGHECYFCAGELGGYAARGALIPKLHFEHQSIIALSRRAFGPQRDADPAELVEHIYAVADEIRPLLRAFIRQNKLDLIVVENALAIPMNLPLGVCLTELIAELGIPTIAHDHDFYWERERYRANAILDLLDTTFPPDLSTIRHVTINSIAQRRLLFRRGIDSVVIPNVFDYDTPPPGVDDFNQDFRQMLGLGEKDLFVLQPTRVVQRKGIELAIALVRRVGGPNAHLYITHSATDEGVAYWHWLQREASLLRVDLQLIDGLIATQRRIDDGHKIYSLWDAYIHADMVTYPSLYEGFGNALLEAIYFKKLTVVNRYPVYNADIRPLGFEFVELNGFVDDEAVNNVEILLSDSAEIQRRAEKNYEIAREHFSYSVLENKLNQVLASFA
jgi:glycosyltransferase involved in cell wall biosynthesis